MRKKIACLLAAALCVTAALGGCSGSGKGSGGDASSSDGSGGTFIVRSAGDPMSFNPDVAGDDNGYPIAQNMFRRLCALDSSKQNLVPEAAESWEYNEDATKLTFHLRDDLKWSDGESLTSEDVKYTFDTIKANPTYYFSASMAVVDSIEAPDDYTVIFNLNKPDSSLVYFLGWYATFIMPEHVYNNGQAWEENSEATNPTVTCGPFKLEEYNQGESVTLVKNEEFADPAKLDKLIFSIIPDEATAVQALQNGEIDFFENFSASYVTELEADPNIRVEINEYPSPIRMLFNFNNDTLKNEAVRKAIAMAVDRDEVSEKVFNEIQKPEYALYPSYVEWAANTEDTAPEFDIEGAKKVLEDAGFTADADGNYITGLTIDVFEGSGYPDTARLIQATLVEVGIQTEIEVSEYNAWSQKVSVEKDFDICLMGGFMGPDPSALVNRIGTGGGSNYGSYSNTKVDELLAQGASTAEQSERATYYKEAQTILAEELPYINIVSFAGPEASNAGFKNLPYDGEGKWAWADYSHVEKAN